MNNINKSASTESTEVFIVDSTSITELSCGHNFESKLKIGECCPVCKKEIVKNPSQTKKMKSRIIVICLLVVTAVLAFILLRPVSFNDVSNGLSQQVNDAQSKQLESYTSINYHTLGYSWLKATLQGKFPKYSPEQFDLKVGSSQVFCDKDGKELFYVTTSNELDGLVAITFADDKTKATIYEVY